MKMNIGSTEYDHFETPWKGAVERMLIVAGMPDSA